MEGSGGSELRAQDSGMEMVSAAGFELEPFSRRLSREAKSRQNGRDLLKEE